MFLFYTPCFQGDKMGTLVLDGLKKLHYPLFYFQYPVRPASLTYDNAPHLATRMKPVQQKVLEKLNVLQDSSFSAILLENYLQSDLICLLFQYLFNIPCYLSYGITFHQKLGS